MISLDDSDMTSPLLSPPALGLTSLRHRKAACKTASPWPGQSTWTLRNKRKWWPYYDQHMICQDDLRIFTTVYNIFFLRFETLKKKDCFTIDLGRSIPNLSQHQAHSKQMSTHTSDWPNSLTCENPFALIALDVPQSRCAIAATGGHAPWEYTRIDSNRVWCFEPHVFDYQSIYVDFKFKYHNFGSNIII